MAPPVVPEWFVSSDDVDFHQWNRADRNFIKEDFPKYHGMWNKASVTIATSPLKPRDFELHATNWFSLRHPNVISLYGACHVSSPLIFVYEFDPSEITLREFLWRKENRHLTWEKLYEAALGIHHMHQRQVAHGYLGDENIVISREGRAKVGGLQIHNATGTPFKSPEEMWSDMTASLPSDIFAFGTCIMNAAASDNFELYEANQGFLSGEIPACVSGLGEEQWDLVVKMCAYEPQARVNIAYVVDQLKKFAMESGNMNGAPSNSAIIVQGEDQHASIDDCKFPGTTVTISRELESILSLLKFHSEAQWVKESVHPALKKIYDHMVEVKVQSTDPIVPMYCDLITRVKDYIRVASEASIARLVRSQQVAKKHHVIFAELDRILDMLQVPAIDAIRTWKRDHSDIDRLVLQNDRFMQEASVIGPKNDAVMLTLCGTERRSSRWGPDGRPVLSDVPPSWYLALRDVRFKQSDSIGQGAFGTVYRGTWLDTPVVIKFMGYEKDTGAVSTRLFLHEVRAWYQLNHPHIIKLFGANHCDKRYFVCEYASNGDLLAYLGRNNCTTSDKWKKMHEVALGLQYMHQLNIVHNDLKCDNILVGAKGEAKIIDFRLSSIPGVADIKVDRKKMGAIHWKSPECLKGERLSFGADVYSLVMCILEVLTDDIPWGRNTVSAMVAIRTKRGEIPNRPAMVTDKQWNSIELMTKLNSNERVKASFVVDKLFEIVNSDENNDRVADSS